MQHANSFIVVLWDQNQRSKHKTVVLDRFKCRLIDLKLDEFGVKIVCCECGSIVEVQRFCNY